MSSERMENRCKRCDKVWPIIGALFHQSSMWIIPVGQPGAMFQLPMTRLSIGCHDSCLFWAWSLIFLSNMAMVPRCSHQDTSVLQMFIPIIVVINSLKRFRMVLNHSQMPLTCHYCFPAIQPVNTTNRKSEEQKKKNVPQSYHSLGPVETHHHRSCSSRKKLSLSIASWADSRPGQLWCFWAAESDRFRCFSSALQFFLVDGYGPCNQWLLVIDGCSMIWPQKRLICEQIISTC